MSNTTNTNHPFIILHASAVKINKSAVVFLGPSGTGKSTIAKLLSPHFETVADDMVYLIHKNEEWLIADASQDRVLHGCPRTMGEGARYWMPLRSTFRLYKDSNFRIIPCTIVETCKHITNAFFEVPWFRLYDSDFKKLSFKIISSLARSMPGYSLFFSQSRSSIDSICKYLVLT